MRTLLIVALVLAAPLPAAAQTTGARTTYAEASQRLERPASWSLADVRAASGNLARWRDNERARMGAYAIDSRTGDRRNAIDEVSGYFAYFGDGYSPGGIIEARWARPNAQAGAPDSLWASYSQPRTICDATLQRATPDIAEIAYLGPAWLPEFEALDAALETEAPSAAGAPLPEGVNVDFAAVPDVSRFYPARALEREQTGVVGMACLVLPDYRALCGTTGETPAGWDFGVAAQRAMRTVRMAQTTTYGEPSVGTCFVKRIRFALPS